MFGYKSGLSIKDLFFIAYAGMIRGAVAFGLVLRIDDSVVNRSVIVTSSLALVIVSTVFMGSTVSSVQRLLFGDLSKKKTEVKDELEKNPSMIAKPEDSISHHEPFLHPNFDVSQGDQKIEKPKKGKIVQVTESFVEKLSKLVIYKYDHKKAQDIEDSLKVT